MRGAHKIKISDLRTVQKSIKQKFEKEVETLTQLMDLPDFDTSEFFQTLLKSQNHMEVLQKIPVQKKVYFFAKNYQAFLQTQDQLLGLQLPKLQQIPKAKLFIFEQQEQQKAKQNFQQSSVLQIIDSFSSFVLQKNVQQTLRVLQIIKQMKKSSKYKGYFDRYSLNKIFLETYSSFIDNCNDYLVLLKIQEYQRAAEVYLGEKQKQILQEAKVNLNLNDSPQSMGKQTYKLVEFIDRQVKIFKNTFKKEIQKNQDLITISCNWVKKLTRSYYSLIQSYIFEKEELSQILQSLNIILQRSAELQSKGVSLERQLKQLIANDLPLHISKVIQIIVDSINEILKQNNDLYEFTYFSSIKTFSIELSRLKPVAKDDYGVKCATCKGIILVNSFILILSTLCDQKWAFIHQGVLDILINKIALNIMKCTLHYWDCYFIYIFFQRLAVGKVKHRQLFSLADVHPGLNDKLQKIKKISENSWRLCQSKIIAEFFKEILSNIPSQLYSFRKYGYNLDKPDLRPSTFSISLVFKFKQFFQQIQFRVNQAQVKYLTMIFYQYILFTIEYVLFWSYHSKGTKDNVFTLHGKSPELLKKIKELNFLQIQEIKQKNILQLSKLNKLGFLKLVFEIYFLSDVAKNVTNYQKIQCQQFCIRLSKILAKDQNKEPIDASRQQFQQSLTKMLKLFHERPQLMHSYLQEKKKQV